MQRTNDPWWAGLQGRFQTNKDPSVSVRNMITDPSLPPTTHQHAKMTVIVAYAPTDVADEDVKDAFFNKLHQADGQAPPHDITTIVTDASATLSSSNRPTGSPVGTTFSDWSTNDNGNHPLLLCHHNNFCVTDTWFPQKLIHHWHLPGSA